MDGDFHMAMDTAAPAATTSVTQAGAYLGGVIGPLLFGFVAERGSYTWAWSGYVGFAAGSLTIVVGRNLLRTAGQGT